MRPTFEVADVLREYLGAYQARYRLSGVQHKAVRAILDCRTAALGGHADVCTDCGHVEISYNSCGNRNCPKCQWPAQQRWMKQRMEELLETTYFHLVFTLPAELNALVMSNEVKLYNLLFRAAWETLDQLARQDQWLGAQPGMIAILHSWGQNLSFHPQQQKTMTLEAVEFIRRFLQHILPPGFHKIRYYGILATRNRATKLAGLQQSLGFLPENKALCTTPEQGPLAEVETRTKSCPACGAAVMQPYGILPAALPSPPGVQSGLCRAPPLQIIVRSRSTCPAAEVGKTAGLSA